MPTPASGPISGPVPTSGPPPTAGPGLTVGPAPLKVLLSAPPSDPGRASSFMNIRVADIAACYRQWSSKGARFLTPPKDHGGEIRCYMRDPDGYLIEVGQATGILAMFEE